MDYYEHGDLFDFILKKKSLSESEAADILYQMISFLKYIHNLGIIFRDLKPDTIMI